MTLPEILVAITILSILFGLLIMPVMKAFGFIRTGTVRVEVQNVGRGLFETLVRETSDALYIYDNKDDPTESSLILVAPHGLASNAGDDPSGAGSAGLPILVAPGPAPDGSQPVVKHLQVALTRAVDSQGALLPYWSQWEMESGDLRGAGLDDIVANPDMKDNLYRLVYVEYYPGSTGNPNDAFRLANVLPAALYDPAANPDAFREPGFIDDSLYTPNLRNTADAAQRRRLLEYSGLLVGLTPRENVDMAWVSYTPSSQTQTGSGAWSAKPGVKFESLSVANESLDPVVTGGATYPSAYRADHGHWQTVRRKDWSLIGTPMQGLPIWARYYQVFDLRVAQRYDGAPGPRNYYVSIGREDSDSGVPPSATGYYYVFRLTGQVPVQGVWPTTDRPTFNMTLYKANIDAWRRRSNENPVTFWNDDEINPYGGSNAALNLLPATDAEPYWPQMAFLMDADRGTVDYRVDAPVRLPAGNEPQPPGPLAPFQAPYDGTGTNWDQPAPDGNRADWMISDVRLARMDANAPQNAPPFREWNNGDALGTDENTTWIRIPVETMRVMVGHPDPIDPNQYVWEAYTRAAERTLLSRGEFWFDEETGQLSFDPNETGNWDGTYKIRAWYQLQTNVQRRYRSYPPDNTDGHSLTASYFSKEVLRLTLALRAYDNDSGKVQPFQLSATVRPRNLR